jgi:hypothetical protein
MRQSMILTGSLVLTLTGVAVHATDRNVAAVVCCPRCDAPEPQCTCSRPQQAAPKQAATPQSGTRPKQGGYVTPSHRGTYAGESNSLGLDIGGIHIPEMHFHLPTVRLPGLRHLRRNPEFLGDAHTAPYVTDSISQFKGTPQAGTRQKQVQPDEGTPKEQSGTRPSSCTVPKAPGAEAALNQRLHRLTEQMTRLQAVVEILATREVAAQSNQETAPTDQAAAPTLLPVPANHSQFEPIQFEPVRLETTQQTEVDASAAQTARALQQAYRAKCVEAERTQAQLLELQKQVAKLIARQQKTAATVQPQAVPVTDARNQQEPLWLTLESESGLYSSNPTNVVTAEFRSNQKSVAPAAPQQASAKKVSRFRRVLKSVWSR